MLPTKFSFIWPSGFREDFLENEPIRNKNCLWWPCLLMDRDEMSNLYRGPAIDASYQVSVHLAKRFQRRRFFFKSANKKQELPMAAMFVIGSGQNEQSLERTFHRCFLTSFTSFGWGVSEEKIKMWKVNGRRTPSNGKSSHCLWQGELKKSAWIIFQDNFATSSMKQALLVLSCTKKQCFREIFFSH